MFEQLQSPHCATNIFICFGAIWSSTQGLFLVQHSGISHGNAGKMLGYAGDQTQVGQ